MRWALPQSTPDTFHVLPARFILSFPRIPHSLCMFWYHKLTGQKYWGSPRNSDEITIKRQHRFVKCFISERVLIPVHCLVATWCYSADTTTQWQHVPALEIRCKSCYNNRLFLWRMVFDGSSVLLLQTNISINNNHITNEIRKRRLQFKQTATLVSNEKIRW